MDSFNVTNECKDTSGTSDVVDGIIVSNNSVPEYQYILFSDGTNTVPDVYNKNFSQSLTKFQKICLTNQTLYTACQFVASACALNAYHSQSEACLAFKNITVQGSGGINEYEFWTGGRPFIEYDAAGNRVLEDEFIETNLNGRDPYTIYNAKFNITTGEFLGFEKLTDQFIKCTNYRELRHSWRVFGSSIQSECEFDLTDYIQNGEEIIAEPFYAESDEEEVRLRPIPVMIRNYINEEGIAVNLQSSERRFRFFRRFFTLDRTTRDNYAVYASNISVVWKSNGIVRPHFEITYKRVEKSTQTTAISIFSTIYERDLSGFWLGALIIILVCGALGIVFWIFRLFVVYGRYGQDGFDVFVILGAVSELTLIVGVLFFNVAFLFSFIIFVGFKWAPLGYSSIPSSETFGLLIPILWTSFACCLISVLFKALMQLRADTFIIDWDLASASEKPHSDYPKILVANEWLKLMTYREVSIPFTLLVLIFLLDGFNIDLLATPIPSSDLIDIGVTYPVLRFAFCSFLMALVMILSFGINHIRWILFGSPIRNFIELCCTANCSVLALMSRSWGFYLHGQSVSNSLEQIVLLDEQEETTSCNNPLTEDINVKIFEVFSAEHFRGQFSKYFDGVLNITNKKPRKISAADFKTFPDRTCERFDELNKFLAVFFSFSRANKEFVTIEEPIISKISGLPPEKDTKSIFYKSKDKTIKRATITGVEWPLCLLNLLLFVGIYITFESACISAFFTYVINVLFSAFYRMIGRENLKRKAILEERFYYF